MAIMRFIKVDEDPDQLTILDSITLASGGSFLIKNAAGTTVAVITEDGDLLIKGVVGTL